MLHKQGTTNGVIKKRASLSRNEVAHTSFASPRRKNTNLPNRNTTPAAKAVPAASLVVRCGSILSILNVAARTTLG